MLFGGEKGGGRRFPLSRDNPAKGKRARSPFPVSGRKREPITMHVFVQGLAFFERCERPAHCSSHEKGGGGENVALKII